MPYIYSTRGKVTHRIESEYPGGVVTVCGNRWIKDDTRRITKTQTKKLCVHCKDPEVHEIFKAKALVKNDVKFTNAFLEMEQIMLRGLKHKI